MDVSFTNVLQDVRQYFQGLPSPLAATTTTPCTSAGTVPNPPRYGAESSTRSSVPHPQPASSAPTPPTSSASTSVLAYWPSHPSSSTGTVFERAEEAIPSQSTVSQTQDVLSHQAENKTTTSNVFNGNVMMISENMPNFEQQESAQAVQQRPQGHNLPPIAAISDYHPSRASAKANPYPTAVSKMSATSQRSHSEHRLSSREHSQYISSNGLSNSSSSSNVTKYDYIHSTKYPHLATAVPSNSVDSRSHLNNHTISTTHSSGKSSSSSSTSYYSMSSLHQLPQSHQHKQQQHFQQQQQQQQHFQQQQIQQQILQQQHNQQLQQQQQHQHPQQNHQQQQQQNHQQQQQQNHQQQQQQNQHQQQQNQHQQKQQQQHQQQQPHHNHQHHLQHQQQLQQQYQQQMQQQHQHYQQPTQTHQQQVSNHHPLQNQQHPIENHQHSIQNQNHPQIIHNQKQSVQSQHQPQHRQSSQHSYQNHQQPIQNQQQQYPYNQHYITSRPQVQMETLPKQEQLQPQSTMHSSSRQYLPQQTYYSVTTAAPTVPRANITNSLPSNHQRSPVMVSSTAASSSSLLYSGSSSRGRRDSPLDLSVKTVRQSADSTAKDDTESGFATACFSPSSVSTKMSRGQSAAPPPTSLQVPSNVSYPSYDALNSRLPAPSVNSVISENISGPKGPSAPKVDFLPNFSVSHHNMQTLAHNSDSRNHQALRTSSRPDYKSHQVNPEIPTPSHVNGAKRVASASLLYNSHHSSHSLLQDPKRTQYYVPQGQQKPLETGSIPNYSASAASTSSYRVQPETDSTRLTGIRQNYNLTSSEYATHRSVPNSVKNSSHTYTPGYRSLSPTKYEQSDKWLQAINRELDEKISSHYAEEARKEQEQKMREQQQKLKEQMLHENQKLQTNIHDKLYVQHQRQTILQHSSHQQLQQQQEQPQFQHQRFSQQYDPVQLQKHQQQQQQSHHTQEINHLLSNHTQTSGQNQHPYTLQQTLPGNVPEYGVVPSHQGLANHSMSQTVQSPRGGQLPPPKGNSLQKLLTEPNGDLKLQEITVSNGAVADKKVLSILRTSLEIKEARMTQLQQQLEMNAQMRQQSNQTMKYVPHVKQSDAPATVVVHPPGAHHLVRQSPQATNMHTQSSQIESMRCSTAAQKQHPMKIGISDSDHIANKVRKVEEATSNSKTSSDSKTAEFNSGSFEYEGFAASLAAAAARIRTKAELKQVGPLDNATYPQQSQFRSPTPGSSIVSASNSSVPSPRTTPSTPVVFSPPPQPAQQTGISIESAIFSSQTPPASTHSGSTTCTGSENSSVGGSPPKLLRERGNLAPPRRRLFSRTDEDSANNAHSIPSRHSSGLRSSSETSVFDFKDSDSEGEMPVLERQTLDEMRRDRKSLAKQQQQQQQDHQSGLNLLPNNEVHTVEAAATAVLEEAAIAVVEEAATAVVEVVTVKEFASAAREPIGSPNGCAEFINICDNLIVDLKRDKYKRTFIKFPGQEVNENSSSVANRETDNEYMNTDEQSKMSNLVEEDKCKKGEKRKYIKEKVKDKEGKKRKGEVKKNISNEEIEVEKAEFKNSDFVQCKVETPESSHAEEENKLPVNSAIVKREKINTKNDKVIEDNTMEQSKGSKYFGVIIKQEKEDENSNKIIKDIENVEIKKEKSEPVDQSNCSEEKLLIESSEKTTKNLELARNSNVAEDENLIKRKEKYRKKILKDKMKRKLKKEKMRRKKIREKIRKKKAQKAEAAKENLKMNGLIEDSLKENIVFNNIDLTLTLPFSKRSVKKNSFEKEFIEKSSKNMALKQILKDDSDDDLPYKRTRGRPKKADKRDEIEKDVEDEISLAEIKARLDKSDVQKKEVSIKKKDIKAEPDESAGNEEDAVGMTLRSKNLSPAKIDDTKKKISSPLKSPSKAKKKDQLYQPGWEEELYNYKRSLRMPERLINIARPCRLSASLPDLNPKSESSWNDADYSSQNFTKKEENPPRSASITRYENVRNDYDITSKLFDFGLETHEDKTADLVKMLTNTFNEHSSSKLSKSATYNKLNSKTSMKKVAVVNKRFATRSSLPDIDFDHLELVDGDMSNAKGKMGKKCFKPNQGKKGAKKSEKKVSTETVDFKKETSENICDISESIAMNSVCKKALANLHKSFQGNGKITPGELGSLLLKSRLRACEKELCRNRRNSDGTNRSASAPPTCRESDENDSDTEVRIKLLDKIKKEQEELRNLKYKDQKFEKNCKVSLFKNGYSLLEGKIESLNKKQITRRPGLRTRRVIKNKKIIIKAKRKQFFLNGRRFLGQTVPIKTEVNETTLCADKDIENGASVGVVRKLNKAPRLRPLRRKFRSGFDYIRKKKKKLPPKDREDKVKGKRKKKRARRKIPQSLEDIQNEIKGWVVNKGLGETLLHRAARLGYSDVAAYCLEKLGHAPSPTDNAGYTPLHEACSRGHHEVASVLLQYGADVSASAPGGVRPLHEACDNGHVEVVRLLLAYGADPLVATYSGNTPFSLASNERTRKLMQHHLADVQGNTAPMWFFRGPSALFDMKRFGANPLQCPPSPKSDIPEEDILHFESSENPIPVVYRLRDDPSEDEWVLLQDLTTLLKIKSRETLLRQLNMPAKNVLREFKMNDFLEQARSLHVQGMCEKFNVRASKVVMVKYTDKVRELLGIEKVAISCR